MIETTEIKIILAECDKIGSALIVLGETSDSDDEIAFIKKLLTKIHEAHTLITLHIANRIKWAKVATESRRRTDKNANSDT